MMRQKDFVVEQVKNEISFFVVGVTHALSNLTDLQLERIKHRTAEAIGMGLVDYGKDRTNYNEVRAYARSMVMNHLKKAKELNGGTNTTPKSVTKTNQVGSSVVSVSTRHNKKIPKEINISLLNEDMIKLVESLV
jgi:hypothetical protein